jgi:hypothetical protein
MSHDLETYIATEPTDRPIAQPRGRWRNARNAPCPCGSGTKFKKCHGSPAARRVATLPAGRYICDHPDPAASVPRGEIKVIQDERGFPTIYVDQGKRWPIHFLPKGTRLRPLNGPRERPEQ